jgi:hypothetical protein
MKISNFPASASGIQIDVLLDTAKLVVNASDSSFSFDPADYFIGDHAIKTIFKNIAGFATDTSYFKVFPAVTPVVKASADITNVINLSTPVTITATNIGGGGTNPLYSFAKDKGFINILQVQSSNNKLVIEPGSLEVGNNWIYVRMLTNELCYSNSTGSDSINITRDAATGIVDLDNPGRIIRVYPNPFSEKITIDGLISSKKYLINIYYTTGQIKLSKYVINQLSINLNTGDLTKGVYWLSIYDDIHRKFLGSVKIIKQ